MRGAKHRSQEKERDLNPDVKKPDKEGACNRLCDNSAEMGRRKEAGRGGSRVRSRPGQMDTEGGNPDWKRDGRGSPKG